RHRDFPPFPPRRSSDLLVREFLRDVDARVLRGRCLPYGEGITFWPIVELLEGLPEAGDVGDRLERAGAPEEIFLAVRKLFEALADRKSTRLNSSHDQIS